MTKNEYNGWTNYETWVVKLWMDNEEGSQRHFAELAEETLTDGSKAYNITLGEHELGCVCEKRAIQSFGEIAKALQNASVDNIVVP